MRNSFYFYSFCYTLLKYMRIKLTAVETLPVSSDTISYYSIEQLINMENLEKHNLGFLISHRRYCP